MVIRLDKYLCDMQAGTRSAVKDIIRKKKVTINGEVITRPETKVDTDKDVVTVDNNVLGYSEYEYYMLNKPAGVVSAVSDKNFKTVVELITDKKRKDLFPVGRLDKDTEGFLLLTEDTEGLLIITNNGDMAHRLLSPKHHIDKTYYVVAKGSIDNKYIDEFKNGLVVDKDFTAMPAKLEILQYNNQDDTTFLNITIQEGKFHQIKRMFKAAGSEVLYLKRLSMGQLQLDETLEPGKFRPLTGSEIDLFKSWN